MRRLLRSGGAAALAACALVAIPAAAPANVQVARRAGPGATRCRRATRWARWRFSGATGYAVGDFGTLLKN